MSAVAVVLKETEIVRLIMALERDEITDHERAYLLKRRAVLRAAREAA